MRPEQPLRGVFILSTVGELCRPLSPVMYTLPLAVVWKRMSLEEKESLGKELISKTFRQEIILTQAMAARLAA